MTTTVQARDGDTVDALCWRELGGTAAVTEQVLTLNPGLADLGTTLPGGTPVFLPDVADTATATIDIIQLWDADDDEDD